VRYPSINARAFAKLNPEPESRSFFADLFSSSESVSTGRNRFSDAVSYDVAAIEELSEDSLERHLASLRVGDKIKHQNKQNKGTHMR
jgi:hypothetical protein